MRKLAFFLCFLFIIPFLYADTSYNSLTKGQADTLYCQLHGFCTIEYLIVKNLSVTGSFFNVSVANYNVTGMVNAFGYNINGSSWNNYETDPISPHNDTDVHFNNANLTKIVTPNNIQVGGAVCVLSNYTGNPNTVSQGYTGATTFTSNCAVITSGSGSSLGTACPGAVQGAPLTSPFVVGGPSFLPYGLPKTLNPNQLWYSVSSSSVSQTTVATITNNYLNVTNITIDDRINLQMSVTLPPCGVAGNVNASFMRNRTGIYLCSANGLWVFIG